MKGILLFVVAAYLIVIFLAVEEIFVVSAVDVVVVEAVVE